MRHLLFIVALLGLFAFPLSAFAQELALKRVMLSSGGLGYFEYEASVEGDATLRLTVSLEQVDDVLKSLVVYDDKGGVGGLSLPGREPLAQAFKDLPFDQEQLNSPADLLATLKGAQVTVGGARAISGRIVSVQEETVALQDGKATTKRTRVTLLTDRGLQQFILEDAENLQFADPGLRDKVGQALMAIQTNRAKDARTLELSARGLGQRTVRVAYVVEVPVWKASYRLTLAADPAAPRSAMQGWATVENLSGQDWKDVELTLVSGRPVAFRQALYEAYYVKRPEVPPGAGPELPMTVIALDAMGGDFAPRAVVEGAARASREEGLRILLVGDQERIAAELRRWRHNSQCIEIHHTPDVVTMEDAPTVVLRERPRASVRLACELVRDGAAQAVLSAGNSGAFMVAAKHVLGTLPGIDRPAIATMLPLKRGATVLIDSGANVDCKPQYLVQFGQMGALFARRVLGVEQPRVGLLNNGTEPGKGNELARAAFDLLQRAPLAFVGNVESRDLFRGKADVLVCDGYVGNLVLKTAEAVGSQLRLLTKDALARSPLALLGYWLVRGFLRELAKRTDYHQVGGSPLLGLQHVAIVCHGSSSARTILAGVRVARQCVEQNLVRGIAEELARVA